MKYNLLHKGKNMAFDITTELLEELKENPSEFRICRRMPFSDILPVPMYLCDPVGDEITVSVLDSETTGFDCEACQIIEIGIVNIRISPSTGAISSITHKLSQLEEPTEPLTAVITEVTGLTDDMLSGKSFDEDQIAEAIKDSDLIVAHNAAFDRPFFDKRFPELSHLVWACSMTDITWSNYQLEGRGLQFLMNQTGYFFDGHRAIIDAFAVVWLLRQVPGAASCELITSALKERYVIRAWGSPYAAKNKLRKYGFSWDDGSKGLNKHWHISVDKSEIPDVHEFLDTEVYGYANPAQTELIPLNTRFK